ncbi:MAG: 2-C-methyl-D-erythritol 4-phosphate cytidylyltransferase [Candidatus Omnitrophica bacterium]|nr:2-C-methyl-D-erythritol 4-phosphate cytidylyltransferase [Candidatus Omnitrophota bacterium]MDD5081122.1 2-C-methyl-D-erythritol 4-phosphate cytidylyltransferase [Candidatus Omnitrophota bacterium]
MKIGAVIVGAGKGIRLGNVDKAAIRLNSRSLLSISSDIFLTVKAISSIVAVVGHDRINWAKRELRGRNVVVTEGGKRRRDSVLNGIKMLDSDIDYVIIHDAARPFIDRKLVGRILTQLKSGEKAVICARKVSDTIKSVKSGYVDKTLDRDRLIAVHTPQAFERRLLIKAYTKFTKEDFTDDAQAIERLGTNVKIVDSYDNNFKITYPGDLLCARVLAKKRSI